MAAGAAAWGSQLLCLRTPGRLPAPSLPDDAGRGCCSKTWDSLSFPIHHRDLPMHTQEGLKDRRGKWYMWSLEA